MKKQLSSLFLVLLLITSFSAFAGNQFGEVKKAQKITLDHHEDDDDHHDH